MCAIVQAHLSQNTHVKTKKPWRVKNHRSARAILWLLWQNCGKLYGCPSGNAGSFKSTLVVESSLALLSGTVGSSLVLIELWEVLR